MQNNLVQVPKIRINYCTFVILSLSDFWLSDLIGHLVLNSSNVEFFYRIVCKTNVEAVSSFEEALFPLFQQILQQDVQGVL